MRQYLQFAAAAAIFLLRVRAAQANSVPETFQCALPPQYELSAWMSPAVLKGDFNGDGIGDTAALVAARPSGKKGIAVCDGRKKTVVFLGAGTEIGNGGDNFDWMDHWSIAPKSAVHAAAAKSRGDALFVEKTESASAVISFDGRRYRWHQEGD